MFTQLLYLIKSETLSIYNSLACSTCTCPTNDCSQIDSPKVIEMKLVEPM